MSRKAIDDIQIDGFKMIRETAVHPASVERADKKPRIALPLEKRLDNWRKTVRDTANASNAACAFWAKEYIAIRNKQHEKLAMELQLVDTASPLRNIDSDLLDGWLIEAIIRSMSDFEEKQVLRFRYVWNYPDHWIKAKLHIRDNALRIVFARALNNLQKLLDMHVTPARIRTYNLHAGVDPRLEAKAVPVGTLAPLETVL